MPIVTTNCRCCGREIAFPEEAALWSCAACGTMNARPQAEGEALGKLQRATRLRLKGEFAEAESCYRHVLVEYDDEHEALWGKLLCQYGVEFITDPKTGVRHATVHIPRSRPMQLHADFARACELAPEEIRAQYEAEAAYVDQALAEIIRRRETGEPCDVFICHKTTPLEGEGYTEDYNRGVQLCRRLEKAGYNVFFAPFADLAPGAGYEAGIYHALWKAKVMLLISSDTAFLTSPWVKSEWSRFLEMLDDGADKHLIPLMYDRLPDARMPREIRLRALQSIRMEDVDAAEKLMDALARYVGRETATVQQPVQVKPIQPVQQSVTAPVKPVQVSRTVYASESHFTAEAVEGGVAIMGYNGPGGEVLVPPTIGGRSVVEIGEKAFWQCSQITSVSVPASVANIGKGAFGKCDHLTSVRIPGSVKSIGECAFQECTGLSNVIIADGVNCIEKCAFYKCTGLQSVSIPGSVTSIENFAFSSCTSLQSVRIPVGVTRIGKWAFSACSELQSVRIPDSVRNIEEGAFYGCTKLPFLLKTKLIMMGAM